MLKLTKGMTVCLVTGFVTIFPVRAAQVNGMQQQTAPIMTPKTDTQNSRVSLTQYLSLIGEKWDVYFTVEGYNPFQVSWPFATRSMNDMESQSLDEALSLIPKAFSKAVVLRDASNPAIVHIVDERLLQNKAYFLNQTATVSYNGLVEKLPQVLDQNIGTNQLATTETPFVLAQQDGKPVEEKVLNLGKIRVNNSLTGNSNPTRIKFSVRDTSTRQILSNFLPMADSGRILWQAYTVNAPNNKSKTTFFYEYLNSRLPVRVTEAPRPVPFDLGELAYKINPDVPEVRDQALAFLTAQLKMAKPLQVRWAMFYLGKYKIERSVPTLLENIGYEYSPSPLVEERFPALRALREIGVPAANAALQKLLDEANNPLRLELLCRVIISVNGVQEGTKEIDAVSDKIADAVQKKRIADALNKALQPTPETLTEAT